MRMGHFAPRRLGTFGKVDLEHPLGEHGVGLSGVHRGGDVHHPLELAVPAFHAMKLAPLGGGLGAPLSRRMISRFPSTDMRHP